MGVKKHTLSIGFEVFVSAFFPYNGILYIFAITATGNSLNMSLSIFLCSTKSVIGEILNRPLFMQVLSVRQMTKKTWEFSRTMHELHRRQERP
jgi:hypothetical protein